MTLYDLPHEQSAQPGLRLPASATAYEASAFRAPITAVTIVAPTKNEADNIEPLVRRLETALAAYEVEVIVVDDSDDDTPAAVLSLQGRVGVTLRLIHRPHGERTNGLGGAVVAGMAAASHSWVCVMDADLQHPPEVVPQLIERAEQTGASLVVGSRYCKEGHADGLTHTRSVVSHVAAGAAWCAFPRRLKGVSDPMSGFFLVQRSVLDLAMLCPDGFKILLEIIVRTPELLVAEVGFRFAKRHAGESKASLREGMRYLRHLGALRVSLETLRIMCFLLVGLTGLVVNMLVLAATTELLGLHYLVSAVIATEASTLWNFLLTEYWVFKDRSSSAGRFERLLLFVVLNNGALLLRGPMIFGLTALLGLHYLLSNFFSILLLTVVRYLTSDNLIWRAKAKERRQGYSYDIHGIITVASTVWLPELERFLVQRPIAEPTIRVRIGPVLGSGATLAGQSRVEGRQLRYDEGLGALGFGIDVTLGPTIEVVATPLLRFSPHVLYTNVVEPILRWTFVEKGYALVHGACIAFGEHGFLVTARTDTGKTTTILRILDRQRRASDRGAFLSDDLTLLCPDGRMLTYPKPLTISKHTVAAIHQPLLSGRERLGLLLQSRLHSRDGRRFAMWLAQHRLPVATINTIVQLLVPPPKYHVQKLVPHVHLAPTAQFGGMIVIERGGEGSRRLSDEESLGILMQNCDDAYGFPPYDTIKTFLHGTTTADLVAQEREIVSGALAGHPAMLLQSNRMDWSFRIPALADAVIGVSVDDEPPRERQVGGADLALGV